MTLLCFLAVGLFIFQEIIRGNRALSLVLLLFKSTGFACADVWFQKTKNNEGFSSFSSNS